jgi:hypothetical protein
MKFVGRLTIAAACWGCLVSSGAAFAAGPKSDAAKPRQAAPAVTDIALSAGNTFTGQVVDAQGHGVDGAAVSVRQGGKDIAKTTTSKEGYFSVTGLKGGTYEVEAGQGRGMYRFWATNTAPPSAQNQALLVSDAKVVRGQLNFGTVPPITYAALGTGIAGTTLGAVNLSKLNNIQDQVNKIPTSP